jgi:hypothetical protein
MPIVNDDSSERQSRLALGEGKYERPGINEIATTACDRPASADYPLVST